MKRTPKIIFLVLILLLPVIIFLFLKFFGRNEFAIPVYYEAGVPADTLGCSYGTMAPYRVGLGDMKKGVKLILLDGGDQLMSTSERNNLLKRIQQNGPAGLQVMVYYNKEAGAPIPLENVKYIPKSPDSWGDLHCEFVTSSDRQLILLDEQQKIRGYYGLDLEEADRLLVELDILVP